MKTKLILSIGVIAASLFAGNPQLAIDKAGNLVDEQGKIKYYVAQSMGHVEQGRITLYGKLWRGKYPEKYRYLYEGFRDEDYFRRTGMNMMHFETENTELAALVPEFVDGFFVNLSIAYVPDLIGILQVPDHILVSLG